MATIASLIVDVAANTVKLNTDVDNINKKLDSMGSVASNLGAELTAAFSVTAIAAFGEQILSAGDRIMKMSDQTGLATDEVQKLMYISGQTGTSVESLVGAVQNLQQRLGDENTGAAGAMAKLGVHMDAFLKLGSYDQMLTLAEGIRNIHDPTEQASLAAALFGKTWKEILPAIKSGMQDVGDQAPIMSDSTVKSLDAIGDAMKRAHEQAIAWGGGFVVLVERAGFAVGDFLSTFDPSHWGVANSQLLKMQSALADPSHGLLGAFAAIKPPVVALIPEIKQLGMSHEEAARQTKLLNDKVHESIEEHKRAAEQVKKHREALRDLFDADQAVIDAADAEKRAIELAQMAADQNIRAIQERGIPTVTNFSVVHQQLSGSLLGVSTVTNTGVLPALDAMGTHLDQVRAATETMADRIEGKFRTALGNIPNIFVQAFTGDGGVMGALKAIGVQLLDAIIGDLLSPMLDAVAKYVAQMIAKFVTLKAISAGLSFVGLGGSSLAGAAASGGASAAANAGGAAAVGAAAGSGGGGGAGGAGGAAAAGGGGGAAAAIAGGAIIGGVGAAFYFLDKSEREAVLEWQQQQYDAANAYANYADVPGDIKRRATGADPYASFDNQIDPYGGGTPGFANGVENFRGGWAMVGERGPEMVRLPKGSNVYPNSDRGEGKTAPLLQDIKSAILQQSAALAALPGMLARSTRDAALIANA